MRPAADAAAASARASAALRRDLAYLLHLHARLCACLAVLACSALAVHAVGLRLPSPRHRRLRLALGVPPVVAAAAFSAALFDPSTCALGAVAAATLAAFNAPLRAAQLLATPLHAIPHPRASAALPPKAPAPATGAALAVLLSVVPACPLLPPPPGASPPRSAPRAAGAPLPSLLRALAQFALGSLLVVLLPAHVVATPAFVLPFITLLTSGFATLSASVFALASGIPVSAPFSWPWLSPSLASFWAWRWNSPLASALRAGVHDPLVLYAGAHPAAAVLAAFTASGAAHAYILRAAGIADAAACARVFAFFALQCPAVLAERALRLPPRPRRALALLTFPAATHFLFVLPIVSSDAFPRVAHELGTGARVVWNCAILAGLADA